LSCCVKNFENTHLMGNIVGFQKKEREKTRIGYTACGMHLRNV